MKKTQSTVDQNYDVVEVGQFDIQKVVNAYKNELGIDISRFVSESSLHVYACEQTGLRFYRGIDPGDGPFYENLMRFDWYYIDWKWEHEVVKSLLTSNDYLLEIGCGNGGFLNGIREICPNSEGIELNDKAVEKSQSRGLKVFNDSLESLVEKKADTLDYIVSFQVLEHVQYPGAFLKSALLLLKSGGKLIVSVPNNDSFLRLDKFNTLNLPPHHMNLWDESSLTKVGEYLGTKPPQFHYEPLQDYHKKWYVSTMLAQKQKEINQIPPVLRGWHYRKLKKSFTEWVDIEQENINGHSILAIFEKK